METKKILIVDDEPEILDLIKDTLKKSGFNPFTAKDASQAVSIAQERKPNLIVLDLGLPGISGWEVCKILKSAPETKKIPIIIMTAKYVTPDHIVKGLNAGADDYITKPFKLKILIARINAVLRRKDINEPTDTVVAKNIKVNLDEHQAYLNGKKISLTPKEFSLLVLLLKKQGRVLSRAYLMDHVWGYEYYGTTRTVDKHIENLRKKIGKEGKNIETIEGVGYKYNVE